MSQQQSVLRHLMDILNSIDTDLLLPLRTHEKEGQGGFLSISRQVFCYIDYLGALSTNGENTSKNAVAYMEKYLVRANSQYAGKSDLMYNMWRHGTVHEYDPKIFRSEAKQFRLRWGANNSSRATNRKWHLACLCRENKPNCCHWFINLFELVEDLKESIRWFIHDLKFDEEYLAKAESNLDRLSQEVDLDKPGKANLMSEAEKLVAETSGVIDERNNVIREFQKPEEFEKYRRDEWGK